MFLHYVIFILLLGIAYKTKPDNASFRSFLQSLAETTTAPARNDGGGGGLLSSITGFFTTGSTNLPEFKTTDCGLFTLHELEDGRIYVGLFSGLFFNVHNRGSRPADGEDGRATVDNIAEGIVAKAVKAKASNNYSEAGSRYLEAANLLRSNTMLHEAGENFEAAYKAFQHIKDNGRARQALLQSATCFKEDPRTLSRAGRAFENVSQMERKEKDLESALEHLVEAQSCFERAEDGRAISVSMAVADLTAEAGDYHAAIARFEDCAAKIADDNVLAYKLPNLLLDACLCAMVADSLAFARNYRTYLDRYPRFENSSAGVAARSLALALDSNDIEAFDRCVSINRSLFEGWKKVVLDAQRAKLDAESIT